MNMENSNPPNIKSTLLAIPLAFVVWAVVFVLAHVALYLLDSWRGLSDDWMQGIFREWFTPGVGGYAAIIAVNKYLQKASLEWAAIGFCSPIVVFYIFFSLYIIIFHSGEYSFQWKEQFLNWGMAIATCMGAYIGVHKHR